MAEVADEPVKLTKQKACVLKASIHCEGCKRKVKKIISQVQGVEFVDVDTKLQKVTVFGNVEPETLLKKLLKSGKHAELWPQEKSHKNEKKSSRINEEKPTTEKQKKVAHNQQAKNPTSEKAVKEPEPSGKSQVAAKSNDGALKSAGKKSVAAENIEVKTDGGDASVKTNGGDEETKLEKKKTDEGLSEMVEKSNGGGESAASGKKKKKKGQNRNLSASASASASAAPGAATPAPSVVAENYEPGPPLPTTHSPPRGQYNPPTPHHYYTPPTPPPVYGVSYNTAYPTSSHTTSYYSAPPPYSYAYAYPEAQPPPSDQEYPRQPLDSFEIFSDENPNGCSVA